MKNVLFILIFSCLFACTANKKVAAIWTPLEVADQASKPSILPTSFELYALDVAQLQGALDQVGNSEDQAAIVQLPNPEGEMRSFKVWASSVVSKELLAKFPNLRAYQGFDTSNVTSRIRMEMPETGMQAMVSSVGATWFVSPFNKEAMQYMVFYKKDYPSENKFWEGRIK